MVSVGDSIRILITGDGAAAITEFKKVGAAADANLKKADGSGKNLSNTLLKTGVAAAGVGLVIGAGLFEAAKAASNADLAHQKLLNTIKNSPVLVGASTAAFDAQANALEKTTTFSHITTTTVQAMLGQFKATQSQVLTLTPLVEDFAAKFGIDTTAAAKAVGKALEGTGGGLKRYGIITGITAKTTDNYDRVVKALRGTVGGFATQEGKTFSGQIAIIKNELTHAEQQIGAGVIPVMRQLGGIVGGVTGGFTKLDAATGGTIGKFATYGATALIVAGGLTATAGIVGKLGASLKDTAVSFKFLTATESEAAAAGAAEGAALDLSLGPLGAVALAVGAVAAAYYGLSHAHRESLGPTIDFTSEIKNNKLAFDDAKNAVIAYIANTKGLQSYLDTTGITADQFADAVIHGGKAYDAVKAKMGPFGDALKNERDAYLAGQKAAGLYAKEQSEKVAAANAKAEQSQVKATVAFHDGRDAYGQARSAAENAARATKGAGEAASKTADDYYKIRRAVDDATNAMFAQADAGDKVSSDTLKLGDDLQTVKDDTKAYHDELKKGPQNADATSAALRKLQEDLLGVSGDLRGGQQDAIAYAVSMTHGAKDASDAIKNHATDFVTSLHKVAAQLAPGSEARTFLDQYAAKIAKGIPDKKVTKITADTSAADRAVSSFINNTIIGFASLGVKVDAVTLQSASILHQKGGDIRGKRAAGGPVEADKRYLVGEQGPELFVPRTSGTIIPNGRMRSAGGGGGGTTTVNQYITITNPDPKAVVDALERAALNGTKPSKRVLANA